MASEAEKFADRMGAAAKQIVDALIKLMKQMEEQKAKLRQADLDKQAAIDKELGKMLKKEGFEASPENIEKFKQHGENIKNTEQKLGELDDQISKLESLKPTEDDMALLQKRDSLNESLDVIGKEHEEAGQKLDDLTQERLDLMKLDDPTEEQQERLGNLDQEISDTQVKIKGLEKEMTAVDSQIRGVDDDLEKLGKDRLANMPDEDKALLQERGQTAEKLEGLKNGKGLEGLKTDDLKQSLKVFKANSVGDSMMKSNSLSNEAKLLAGVEKPEIGKTLGNIGVKGPGF